MATSDKVLQSQVAVVTGGGYGIGAEIAARLAKMGATTIICGRSLPPLQETQRSIASGGGSCEAMACDVTDLNAVETLARKIRQRFDRVDILVNNAGVGDFSHPLHELPPEAFDRIIDTNLRGPFHTIRAFAPMMIAARSGHIINISSIASRNAVPKAAAYAASKWGLNGMSFSVAEELRGYNIRVSVICPGSVNTELVPTGGRDPNKMLRPSDVAHVVAMLVTQAPQSFASEVVLRPTLKP
jgi:NAD(P)-dependent dehydrogenase (short-subunit alcohol dehydrogenase family)